MIRRPCPPPCGKLPVITERKVEMLHVVQVKCACGNQGAQVAYIKPADRERTIQAAADGWNLG